MLVPPFFKCHLQKVKKSLRPWSFKKRASPLFLFRAMIVEVVSNSCFAPWRAKFHSRPLLRWSGARVEVWGRAAVSRISGDPCLSDGTPVFGRACALGGAARLAVSQKGPQPPAPALPLPGYTPWHAPNRNRDWTQPRKPTRLRDSSRQEAANLGLGQTRLKIKRRLKQKPSHIFSPITNPVSDSAGNCYTHI